MYFSSFWSIIKLHYIKYGIRMFLYEIKYSFYLDMTFIK